MNSGRSFLFLKGSSSQKNLFGPENQENQNREKSQNNNRNRRSGSRGNIRGNISQKSPYIDDQSEPFLDNEKMFSFDDILKIDKNSYPITDLSNPKMINKIHNAQPFINFQENLTVNDSRRINMTALDLNQTIPLSDKYRPTYARKKSSLDLVGKPINVTNTFQRPLTERNYMNTSINTAANEIYPRKPDPFGLINCTYTISNGKDGVDLFASAGETYFNVKIEQLIEQIFSGEKEIRIMKNGLDSKMKSVLEKCNKERIRNFLSDYLASYKVLNPEIHHEKIDLTFPRHLKFGQRVFAGLVLLRVFVWI